jgi:hypothetical protein
MLFENKVVVTGAGTMLFAREGVRVVIADLNRKGADAAELGATRAIGVETG